MPIAINEMFYSIQGEGPNAGAPAVFIRFQGCQLRCPWCDTGSSLDPDDPHRNLTPDKILAEISAWPCKHVVITGGDPSFQIEALDELSHFLLRHEYTLEMETSGLRPVPLEICHRFERINVGLKLPNESQPFADSYYRAAIAHYRTLPQACFKIVIDGEEDIRFVVERLIGTGLLRRERVVLMPLGITPEEQNRRAPLVIEACKAHGFRFTPRLHIMFAQR